MGIKRVGGNSTKKGEFNRKTGGIKEEKGVECSVDSSGVGRNPHAEIITILID